MIRLTHNLDPSKFEWLWAKYVTGLRDDKHCTNCIRGRYSAVLSAHNLELISTTVLQMDERQDFAALYVCGVVKAGYRHKQNYPHNLHLAIRPRSGSVGSFDFENWHLGIENGEIIPIPTAADIPARYRNLPSEFTTCRIFRFAVGPLARILGES